MAELFEATSICGMRLANRFVRSATWEGMADEEGYVTPKLTERLMALAKGKVGLIIGGFTFVSKAGWASVKQVAAYDPRFLPGLKEMVQSVHASGGKIAMQLAHGGFASLREKSGLEPVAPSVIEKEGEPLCRAATAEDLAQMVADFTAAAVMGKQAGFDAVQVHAAHGYLLSQFLSPTYNKRTDQYGGSLENRARLLLEIVHSVRQAVGEKYPVLVKMNSEDFMPDGLTREEAIEVALMLERASVDALELSGGVPEAKKLGPVRRGVPKAESEEGYFAEAALQFKEKLKIPLILVGGIRSLSVAQGIVSGGVADYVSMSRPFIREPGLVGRWKKGDRNPSSCLSCNGCFTPGNQGLGVSCVAVGA